MNESTPRKLRARYNAVTSLSNTNEATFGGSGNCYSASDSIRPTQKTAETPRKLGARQNPNTSVFNTNEATSDESRHRYSSSESSLPTQSNAETRKLRG